jgi:hypothetical protein
MFYTILTIDSDISLYGKKWFPFVMDMDYILCHVGNELLYIIYINVFIGSASEIKQVP